MPPVRDAPALCAPNSAPTDRLGWVVRCDRLNVLPCDTEVTLQELEDGLSLAVKAFDLQLEIANGMPGLATFIPDSLDRGPVPEYSPVLPEVGKGHVDTMSVPRRRVNIQVDLTGRPKVTRRKRR